ncbi:hypothetical protein FRC10_002908 [Ceratobasidium sp. 414]|nr:hypothetical protein FRC10_002908 [Ceratobasidium sp. 414]
MTNLLANGHTGFPHDLISASSTGQNAIFCTSGNVEGPPSKPTAAPQPNTPTPSGPKARCEVEGHEPPPPPKTPPPKPPKGHKARVYKMPISHTSPDGYSQADTPFGDELVHMPKSEPDGGPSLAPKPIPPPLHPDPVRPPPPAPACGTSTRLEPDGRGCGTLDASCEAPISADVDTAPVQAAPNVGNNEPGGSFNSPEEPPEGPLVPPQPKTPPPPSAPKCQDGHQPPPPPPTPPPKPPKSKVCSRNTSIHPTATDNSRKVMLPGVGAVQAPKSEPGGEPGRAPKPVPPVPHPDPVSPPPRPHKSGPCTLDGGCVSRGGPEEAPPKNPRPKTAPGQKPPPPPPTPPVKPPKSSKGVFKPVLKFGPNSAPKPVPPYPDPVRPPPRPHEPLDQPGSLCSYANEWHGSFGWTTFGEGGLGAKVVAVMS